MPALSIHGLMDELKACLCASFPTNDQPGFCGVLIGSGVPALWGDECGVSAYVRLLNAFPSTQAFPEPDGVGTCRSILAYNIAVGVIRCVPGMGEAEGPTQAELDAHSALIAADMAAIYNSIRCCLLTEKFEDMQHVLGLYTPIDGEEGVSGGEWILTVQEQW